MVGDQPNRALLDSLGPNSAILRKQSEDLCTVVNSAPFEIVNFYETQMSPTARLSVTGQHYPQITFNDAERISMEKVNQDDIALFTQKSISNISRLTDAEKGILHAEIVRRSKGVFQWAALVVQNVRRMKLKGKSFRFILESVQQVPDDLNRLYGELLALAENRTQTVKLFQWVLYARNPLSISELRHALSLDQDMSEDSIAQYEEHPEYPSEEDMENVLNDLSVGLVEVLESQKVEFIHQSVPDYLLEGEIVELLLVAKATIDVRDDEGRTPISHAAQNGFTTIVRILIRSEPLEWKSKAQLNEKHVKIEESLVARFGGQVEGAVLMTRAF
ncbi:hypothetical protein SLS57_007069 [Botryosphaeria dothidea]